jgi:hypothetical protein
MGRVWILLIGALLLPLLVVWVLVTFAPVDTRTDTRDKVADDDVMLETAVQHLLAHAAISSTLH